MPFKIGEVGIPFNGRIYFYYDPLEGKFAASQTDACPPDSSFRLTLAEALKLVESSYDQK